MGVGVRIGFCGFFGLLFVGLRLGRLIDWSWWWVLSPFWIGPAIVVTILVLVATVRIFESRDAHLRRELVNALRELGRATGKKP